jgi:hypothetical protein
MNPKLSITPSGRNPLLLIAERFSAPNPFLHGRKGAGIRHRPSGEGSCLWEDGKPGRILGSEIEEEGTGVHLTNALTAWDIEPTRD